MSEVLALQLSNNSKVAIILIMMLWFVSFKNVTCRFLKFTSEDGRAEIGILSRY